MTDTGVRVVELSNFGHQTAVTASIERALREAVVLIDADLQDPPVVIAEMVNRWKHGADVVYGLRMPREGETPFEAWTAKAFTAHQSSLRYRDTSRHRGLPTNESPSCRRIPPDA